tara:strand:- start:29432 stop:29665 length:234 start_codon:yes stop_codon:yes gene_type:complete
MEIRRSFSMADQNFSCGKCKNGQFKTGELRTTGSGLSRFFNLQNQKYSTVSCESCGFTELYRTDSGGLGNVLDFLSG